MATTKIEWTESTWNPITGCSPISPGCANCYAARMAKRLAGRWGYPADDPFRVTLHEDRLDEPMDWRKPRHVFVCSMGDLFHEDVRGEWIGHVFGTMAFAPQHTFQVLTKRPERMRTAVNATTTGIATLAAPWPMPNVWLGVTAEDQQRADERIPLLLQTPAAIRFVSVEPMLGPVDLRPYLQRLGWVICGGETGSGARPMQLDWARDLRDQCAEAGVPFFYKQDGPAKNRVLDGREHNDKPEAPNGND